MARGERSTLHVHNRDDQPYLYKLQAPLKLTAFVRLAKTA